MNDQSVPPQALEAEEHVLGAMMMSSHAVDAVGEILHADGREFYREKHAKLYRTALELTEKGEPVDVITLTDALEEAGMLAEIGGRVRLHEIAKLVPASANATHYATILRETWKARELIDVGGKIARLGWERGEDAATLIAEAEALVESLRDDARGGGETMTMQEAAIYLDEKFRNPPSEDHGIPTPWSFLPSMQGGRLYTLGGYQADGKTVQGAHYFRHAVAAGVKTGFLSLEMNKEDMAERIAANMGLPAKSVQRGRFNDQYRGAAAEVLGRMTLWGDTGTIIDDPIATLGSIRRYIKQGGYQFFIVDHLHQFHVRAEYERQDLETIIRGLWQLTREFNIPILLLAQLSRTGDKKNPYPRPTMASLRGSAMIEALSWSVYFIWRIRDEQNLATSESELIVAKNRSGPTGIRHLHFHDAHTAFREIQQ